MHQQAYNLISKFKDSLSKGLKVLDVGSLDVNGTLKPLFDGFEYTGLDIVAGKNVDVVSESYTFPFKDKSFDIVVSSSCLEHVENPHLWAKEIIRVLKPGGRLAITCPHTIHYHNPPHYWNVRKDALNMLFKPLTINEVGEDEIDAYIFATKDLPVSAKVSVIIPVVRPQNIPALLEAIKTKHGLENEPEIIWEEDKDRIGAPKMVNKLAGKASNDLVCFLGDDTMPEQDFLKNACLAMEKIGWGLVGLNDGKSFRKAIHWLAHKELLKQLENDQFFYEGYIHNFCDDELRVRADKLDRYVWCEKSIVKHNHPCFGSAPMDEFYEKVKNPESVKHDKELFESRNCKISVAMIVKNEEVMLPQCLESVKGAFELIIVDTGSTDKTKEVASLYTDKIYDFPWTEDYSEARNFAKSKCTGDWILSIDADEIMQPDGLELLKPGLHTVFDSLGIKMSNGVDTSFHVPRLFKNKESIKWEGIVHETVDCLEIEKCPITISFGHSPAHDKEPERHLKMLEKAHDKEPENTRYMYYLAREYGYYKRYDEATSMFKEYLGKSKCMPEKADAYYQLACIYWNLNRGDEAREACMNALVINSNFKAAIELMAAMSWEHNAEQWRNMAETANDNNTLFSYKTTYVKT